MSRSLNSRFLVKALAFVILAMAPLQLPVLYLGEEPWPTLALPSFADVQAVPHHFALMDIYAYTDSGQQIEVNWSDLFLELPGVGRGFQELNFSPRRKPPSVESTRGKIAERLGASYPFSNYWEFRSGIPHGKDTSVRAWLDERLSEAFDGRSFASLEFVWSAYDGFIRSADIPANAVTESYVIDLR